MYIGENGCISGMMVTDLLWRVVIHVRREDCCIVCWIEWLYVEENGWLSGRKVKCCKGCCMYVRENDYILGRMIVCLREWLYVEENGCVLEVSFGRKVVHTYMRMATHMFTVREDC